MDQKGAVMSKKALIIVYMFNDFIDKNGVLYRVRHFYQ